MNEHPDYKWATEKWAKGHGAVFSYTKGGPLRIDWIYKVSELKLLWYNFILKIKWYRRKNYDKIK